MEWGVKKLGELLKVQNGYAFNSKLFTNETGTPLIRIRDIKKGIGTVTNFNGSYDKKYEVKSGDFLIGMDGEFGCYEWKGDTALLNQRVCRLQDFSNRINSRFLFYGINKYLKAIEEVTAFATVKHISSKQIEAIEIPLPPLPEQLRIVAILDEAFESIARAKESAEKNLKNANEIFESYLQNVFENKKWAMKTLGDVCEKVEYGSSSKSIKEGKIAVLRMGNIQNGRFNWEELVYSDNLKENEKYLLKYNDVLFNRTNSPELVGKTAIYKGEMPAIFAGYLIRIHRMENLLDADYLNYYLNSEMAMNYGKSVATSSVNQANINGTKLKSYPIHLPSLSGQQAIVAKLNTLSAETKKLEAIYTQKLADLEELKKSILAKAFKGELTEVSI